MQYEKNEKWATKYLNTRLYLPLDGVQIITHANVNVDLIENFALLSLAQWHSA